MKDIEAISEEPLQEIQADKPDIALVFWPSPQDYNEAVQTSDYSFSDTELKSAQVALTELGLPLPCTGNFASVYRFSSGGKHWAVRCFLRSVLPEDG